MKKNKKQRHYFANKGPSSQGYDFSSSHIWMWELDSEESWAPKNWCFWTVVLESLGLQGDPTGPSWRRSVLGVHWNDWCWRWNSNTLATSCEELTHRKRPWCWEGLGAGGEGDHRGWEDWMASPTRWTWVWVQTLGVGDGLEVWCAAIHGVAKSQTRLSDWTELDNYRCSVSLELFD